VEPFRWGFLLRSIGKTLIKIKLVHICPLFEGISKVQDIVNKKAQKVRLNLWLF